MAQSEKKWVNRIRIFAYILLAWKIVATIGFSIAGPIYERMQMRNHGDHGRFSFEVIMVMYLIGVIAALCLIKQYRIVALLLFLIPGTVALAYGISNGKLDIFSPSFLVGLLWHYWESAILGFMMWRMRKEDMRIKGQLWIVESNNDQ
jgi:hypothetical protein